MSGDIIITTFGGVTQKCTVGEQLKYIVGEGDVQKIGLVQNRTSNDITFSEMEKNFPFD